MTIQQQVIQKLRQLSPEKQQQVLDFVESLHGESGPVELQSLEGLWADLDIDITEEDIAQARKEMWGNFPRDIS
jgi:hypothetical protein